MSRGDHTLRMVLVWVVIPLQAKRVGGSKFIWEKKHQYTVTNLELN